MTLEPHNPLDLETMLRSPAPRPDHERVVGRDAITSFAVGSILAAVASYAPHVRFVFSYLVVLVHEMGHALAGWLFGYPSLPAFDFAYGGGVTMHGEQSMAIVCAWAGLLLWLAWRHWSNPRARFAWGAVVVVYLLLSSTGAHDGVLNAAGHGTELVIAVVFMVRAIAGVAVVHAIERPLYAACGLFIVLESVRFGYGLATDEATRWLYEQAKGGGHWMDFW